MTYQFYKFSDLNAEIGLFAEGDRLAIRIASGGGGKGGSRNPDRGTAFGRLVKAVLSAVPTAHLLGCRFGRLDQIQRSVSGPLHQKVDELTRAFLDGGWFRFDLWLAIDPPTTAVQLAERIDLVLLDHAPVRVQWPDSNEAGFDDEAGEAFFAALDDAIREGLDRADTDQTRWRALEELIAQKTTLPVYEVVVSYVSASKHLDSRRRQRAGQASLRLLLTPDEETTKAAVVRMEQAEAGKTAQDGAAVAIATVKPEGWRIVNIFALTTPASDAAIRLANLANVELPAADDDASLAKSLFVPSEWLRDILWLLEDRKGLVFYGPPGTGKTFLAQKIAERIQPDPERRLLVQLHPSYGYEEFFEGYRPTTKNKVGVDDGTKDDSGDVTAADDATSVRNDGDHGVIRLAKMPGPMRLLTKKIQNTTEIGVLILDGMNRGNLPRVFGELYFLLEYRKRDVRLMYSPEETFRIPDGFRIIGTMNTADRSVALLDQALRRRFHFVGLFPDEPPVKDMLRNYLKKWYGERMAWVADVLEKANAKLDRNVAIGPSHFMRMDLDEETVRRIWQHSVLPTIEEHYFGQKDRVAEFELKVLRATNEADVVVANPATS